MANSTDRQFDRDQEPEPLFISIYSGGGTYLGSLQDRDLGIETFDSDDVSLGLFSNQEAAEGAVFDHWDIKLRSNSGGSDTPSPPKVEGDSFRWFDRLSGEQKDAALKHMMECIDAYDSKLLDVQNDNNLMPEIARSGAPHAAEISRRYVQKRNGADFVPALRKCFAQRPKSPIGPLIHAAHQCGANFEPWWHPIAEATHREQLDAAPKILQEATETAPEHTQKMFSDSGRAQPPSDQDTPFGLINDEIANLGRETSAKSNGDKAPLEPGRNHLKIFIQNTLRHCDKTGVVSLRSFCQNNANKAFSIKPIPLESGLDSLIEAAVNEARRAANNHEPIAFTPPVATFKASAGWQARQEDLLEGPVLAVDLDKNPRTALATLERLLGPATLVVRSGGQWTNPETDEIEDKLHAYWRLKKPARDEELKKLKELRKLAHILVGGDTSNVPINHPIRWPGSWHRKSTPRPCEIVSTDHLDNEIDLDTALKVLRKAAPAFARPDPDKNISTGDERPQSPPLPFAPIKEGCPWLQCVHATGGRDQSEPLWWDALRCCTFLQDGEKLIHEFSKEHDGYEFEATEEKYEHAARPRRTRNSAGHCAVPFTSTNASTARPVHIGGRSIHHSP
jgi:hypothetical protein